MKIKRSKKVNKILSFYSNNFGFRKPYQILVDGTLCFFALKNKINLLDQLPKYIGAEIKLLTTSCVIIETEKLGPAVFGAMLIAKQFPLHKCGHDGNPLTGAKCLLSMVRKKENRYIIGTQDRDLQEKVRLIAGAPLLYIHQKAPTLEAASAASLEKSEKISQEKFLPEKQSGESVKEIKLKMLGPDPDQDKPIFRRKKIKGPNPLSCKKKQKNSKQLQQKGSADSVSDGKVAKRKNRKRVKIPQHVKEHLKTQA